MYSIIPGALEKPGLRQRQGWPLLTLNPRDPPAAISPESGAHDGRREGGDLDIPVARALKSSQLTCGEWHAIWATVP